MAKYVHLVWIPNETRIDQCFSNINEAHKYARHTYGTEKYVESYRLWDEFQLLPEDEESNILYGIK